MPPYLTTPNDTGTLLLLGVWKIGWSTPELNKSSTEEYVGAWPAVPEPAELWVKPSPPMLLEFGTSPSIRSCVEHMLMYYKH